MLIADGRLQRYLTPQIPPEPSQLIETSREFSSPMFLCFKDYKKAFDFVRWESLWKVLSEMGVPNHLPQNLFAKRVAIVWQTGQQIFRNYTDKPNLL